MSISVLRASIVALFLCAACGNSSTSGGGGAGGGSGGAASSSTSASVAASSSSGAPDAGGMDCELAITAVSGANIDITSFSAPAGQGATKQQMGHPPSYGIAASTLSGMEIRLLNLTVSGDTLTAGTTYTIANDGSSIIELTLNDLSTSTGERDWTSATGSKVTVDAIGPGPQSNYKKVTFGLAGVSMVVDASLGGGNAATGTFTMSGKCVGYIMD